jgi:hypothetical protein
MSRESLFQRQILPLGLTVVVCVGLIGLLWIEIASLNRVTMTDIAMHVRWVDVLVGLTIYLKTSIDFAMYIGKLMSRNPGWKSRVAIEIGTAFGNAAGTMAVLLVWTFFKDVRWLLALMVFVAALVLFKLAQESLEHVQEEEGKERSRFQQVSFWFERGLERLNAVFHPVLKYVIPNLRMKDGAGLRFWPLFVLALTIPFILGLDDFAGYVPLFSVVNVFGFGIGVFVGHMILNIFLYISPDRTIRIVKNPIISFIGSLAFVGLGVWGLTEVVRLIVG